MKFWALLLGLGAKAQNHAIFGVSRQNGVPFEGVPLIKGILFYVGYKGGIPTKP